jgi:hypothetical protein
MKDQQEPTHPIRVRTTVKALQFVLHLASVYFIVYYGSAWLAGRFHSRILPVVDPTNQTSAFQFTFSHIFEFTFIPACVAGLVNGRYWRCSASYVWTVPALRLAHKLITFPTTIFQNHLDMAFHHYFAGGFLIGEFHSYKDIFADASNPDIWRGIDQLHITGFFYAGLGYSLAAMLMRSPRVAELAKAFLKRSSQAPDSKPEQN